MADIRDISSLDNISDVISRRSAKLALCKAVHKDEPMPCDNQTASCLWSGTRVCDYAREIDALPSVRSVITIDWIERYADWLLTIPAPFAANDERAIRAMLTKWRTNPDLPQVGCSEGACEIGG